jgi:hypothetical protein
MYLHVFTLYSLSSATLGCTISISGMIACGVILISKLNSTPHYFCFELIKAVQEKSFMNSSQVFATPI